jgi:glycosyltransferase involved in cell wall biosynthesis
MKVVVLGPEGILPWLPLKYAQGLADAGVSVELIFPRDIPPLPAKRTLIVSACPEICGHSLPFFWRFPRIARKVFPSLGLLRKVLLSRADVYFALDPLALQIAAHAARLHRSRLAYMPKEFYSGVHQLNDSERHECCRIEKKYSKQVDAWISGGDILTEEYIRLYSLPRGRVHTVYNGWPTQVEGEAPLLRERIGVGPDAIVVLYQGLIAKERGVWDMLEAATSLPPHVHFVALGMVEVERLRADVASKGLISRFHVLDAVPPDELLAYTRGADIGVIPIHDTCRSFSLCNPSKLYEYVAASLPLVVSNLEQLKKTVETKQLGEVFQWGSAESLARALRKLVEDPDYRARCAGNVRTHQAEEACWEIQVEKLRSAVLGTRDACGIEKDAPQVRRATA